MWAEIADAVNAVGAEKRTTAEVHEEWKSVFSTGMWTIQFISRFWVIYFAVYDTPLGRVSWVSLIGSKFILFD